MRALKSLRIKAILWTLLPTLIVLSVVAVTSIYVYDRIARDVVQQRDSELAKVASAHLSQQVARHFRPEPARRFDGSAHNRQRPVGSRACFRSWTRTHVRAHWSPPRTRR